MRILSWNVNGVRAARRKGFLSWLHRESPDIIALQETKATPEQLGKDLVSPHGYHAFWHPAKKPGYSGTALFSKKAPDSVSYRLGTHEFDSEGRLIIAEYKDFVLLTAYFPNSQTGRKRLSYKLKFCENVQKLCTEFVKKKKDLILCGDINIAHKPIDLARPEENEDSPGYYIEERHWMDRFLNGEFIDTFRCFSKEPNHYTWWSYRTAARKRNVGWRLDYHFVNREFIKKVKKAFILSDVKGSDHCPVGIEI